MGDQCRIPLFDVVNAIHSEKCALINTEPAYWDANNLMRIAQEAKEAQEI